MTNKNLVHKVVSEEKDILTNVNEYKAPVLSIVTDETEAEKEEIPAPEPASKPVATMTIVEKEEVRKPTLEEKIQRVEDLTLRSTGTGLWLNPGVSFKLSRLG